MKQFYVYFHCKPDGTVFYVGKGHGSRAYNLSPGKRAHNKHHQRIVEKYGKANIKIEIQNCADEREALDLEMLCIQSLREDGIELCNCTDGGEGASGYKHTKEAIQKMLEFRGRFEFREKLRIANLGKPCRESTKIKLREINLGKKLSEETKYKMGLGRVGIKASPQAIVNMKLAQKGRVITEEHRQKISKKLKDNYAKGYRFKHTEEAKIKIGLASKARHAKN